MMEKYEIQKLRELPIEKVAKEMGMKVEHHKALCPFHDDHHASLTFNKTKNSCRCYVCMRNSIGTIDLAMRYLGKDFPAACRWLAEEHQIQLEEDSSSGKSSSFGGSSGRGLLRALHLVVLLRALHPMVLLRVIIRGNLPSMQAGMLGSSNIPGSTRQLGDFSSRRGRLTGEW